jgi:hypothetical protein
MKRFFYVSLFLVTIAGCMDGLKVAPTVQELGATTEIVQLEEGRRIYIHNCTKCHNALRITRYTQQEWDGILPDMIRKSKLSSTQALHVRTYIHAVLQTSSTPAR